MRNNLSKEVLKPLHNLCKKKHLAVQKAGKGSTVAITGKNAYINKMKDIVSDNIKFEQINIEEDKQLNFILKSDKKFIDLIKCLENEGKISEKEYELIYLMEQVLLVPAQSRCRFYENLMKGLLPTYLKECS